MRGATTFRDWVELGGFPDADIYCDALEAMGVSEETFRDMDTPRESILARRISANGEIPPIAAMDIVRSAARFFRKYHELSTAPLAVFWDAENVHIPREMSGLACCNAIRASLSTFGSLETINVYLPSTANTMPASKRSELQLSGCHILDTPHVNRKEVADKMIIVDALFYAMEHRRSGGATICLITSDTDFAYMLSRLGRMPEFRTFLVTDKPADVLMESADHTLSWRADVLMAAEPAPAIAEPPPSEESSEQWDEDGALLLTVMEALAEIGKPRPHRSLVCAKLAEKNPMRFGRAAERELVVDCALNDGWLLSSKTKGHIRYALSAHEHK